MNRMRHDSSGLTLIELMLAMVMLSIVLVAVFSGLEYAFYILKSAGDYADDTYQVIEYQEQNLTLSNTLSAGANASSTTLKVDSGTSVNSASKIDEQIIFQWGDMDYPDTNGFQSTGIRVDWNGENNYLEKNIGIYIPVSSSSVTVP